jgi:transcriptional regulator with XRE-family HTH domain
VATFGKILRSLREEKQLNQETLAKIFNVDRSTLGKWESDSSRPDYTKLAKIADYFQVTTDFLLGRTDEPSLVVLEKDKLPIKLQGEIDAIHIVKDAIDKGISKETIEEILDFVNKVKKNPS